MATMAVDDAALRGARNGFLVVLVALLAVGVLQVVRLGSVSPAIGGTWVAGVLVFYGSKWYYGRDREASPRSGSN
jgi:hypothetical protein